MGPTIMWNDGVHIYGTSGVHIYGTSRVPNNYPFQKQFQNFEPLAF